MRKIKLRAWDKKENKWLFFNENIWALAPEIEEYRNKKEEIVLMQFTGLKDKLGKSIYEGDIISEDNDDLYKVYWSSYNAMFRLSSINSRRNHILDGLFHPTINRYKIIGNLYEHPELLK